MGAKMLPLEEYLARHQLIIPEVYHTLSNGSLFCRVDQSDLAPRRWLLVSLTWKDDPHHPGVYDVKVQTPIHDGCNRRDVWENIRGYPPNLQLQYEEIDEFFREFAVTHGKITAISENPELSLMSWEIFLYTHDTVLASLSRRMRKLIEVSIDLDLPAKIRYRAYLEVVDLLMVEQPSWFEKYEYSIHAHTKKVLGWLVRLINKENNGGH